MPKLSKYIPFTKQKKLSMHQLLSYLEYYRDIIAQLGPAAFAKEIGRLMDRRRSPKSQIASSMRNEFAFVCLHYANTFRGRSEKSAPIQDLDKVLFFPLDPEVFLGYVSHKRLAPKGGKNTVFDFFDLSSEKIRKTSTSIPLARHHPEDGGFADAYRVKLREIRDRKPPSERDYGREDAIEVTLLDRKRFERMLPGLFDLVEAEKPGIAPKNNLVAGTSILAVLEMVKGTPNCLIIFTKKPGKIFDEDERKDIQAVTHVFFQTYSMYKLERYTQAYRLLIDENLLLSQLKQKVGDDLVRRSETFLEFLCNALAGEGVLPQMDNALFFPLNNETAYYYQRPSKTNTATGKVMLKEYELQTDRNADDLARLARKRLDALEKKQGAGAQFQRLYFTRLRNLFTQETQTSREMDELQMRIGEFLEKSQKRKTKTKKKHDLYGHLEVFRFNATRYEDWGFTADPDLAARFFNYSNSKKRGSHEYDIGERGSLLAILILFDHLPLGILFLNSSLTSAFSEEDTTDVRAIAKAYVQTFQMAFLEEIIHDYQDLGGKLSIAGLDRYLEEDPPKQNDTANTQNLDEEFDRFLRLYFRNMFRSFDNLTAGLFLALDRDKVKLFWDEGEKHRSTSIRGLVKDLKRDDLQRNVDCIEPKAEDGDPLGDPKKMSAIYALRLLGTAGAREVDQNFIRKTLDGWAEKPEDSQGVPLSSGLRGVCYEACVFQEVFPELREIVTRLKNDDSPALLGRTGSLMTLALVYDGLPKGLILLCSPNELSFTKAIELEDTMVATRTLLLPHQMRIRESVIAAYQNLFQKTARDGEDVALDTELSHQMSLFFDTMGNALPTLTAAVFVPFDRDQLCRWGAGKPVGPPISLLDKNFFRGEGRQILEGLERVPKKVPIDDNPLLALYLKNFQDILTWRKNPSAYSLTAITKKISVPRRGKTNGGLRSLLVTEVYPSCIYQDRFPYLDKLLDTENGEGSLLAILLLFEGLPRGLIFLASDIHDSFSEHEKADVKTGAQAFFQDYQTRFRDEVIGQYRKIVGEILSQSGLKSLVKKFEEYKTLQDDELGKYAFAFMDLLLGLFPERPSPDITFIPLDSEQVYIGNTGKNGRAHFRTKSLANLFEGSGQDWLEWQESWVRDLCKKHRVTQLQKLPEKEFWQTLLLEGHRYNQKLEPGHAQAYLAPLTEPLSREFGLPWAEREAGSLMLIHVLYDHLPARGLIVFNSPIPWRFIEQDRRDVEAVAKAYFLTYRAIRLTELAALSAKQAGMQQMLLGVTHRLKNDLQPSFTVMRRVSDNKEVSAENLKAGMYGIMQVREKFRFLKSVTSGGRQAKNRKTLTAIKTKFEDLVSQYELRLKTEGKLGPQAGSVKLIVGTIPDPTRAYLDIDSSSLIENLDTVRVNVTDGFDEVLTIHAENAVRELLDQNATDKKLYLWFCHSPSRKTVRMFFYDRIVIPRQKMKFIEKQEVIASEEGARGGTGFFNAANLLNINEDGKQTVTSCEENGGTTICLELSEYRFETELVPLKTVLDHLQELGGEARRKGILEWRIPNGSTSGQLLLYRNWRQELFKLCVALFARRLEVLKKGAELDDSILLPVPFVIDVSLQDSDGDKTIVELADNTRDGFFIENSSPEDQKNIFINAYSGPYGDQGPLGELFLGMKENLSYFGISVELGKNAGGFTAVSLSIPSG